jgi:DNA replication protein DnaC
MLILAGRPGCGKTYLCSALVAWMYGKVRDLYGFKESKFLERIRKSMELQGDYREEIEYQCDRDLFILDDMGSSGKGSATGWRQDVAFEVLNLRYESQRPTVFSTNFSRKQILEVIGERAYSRMYAKENYIVEMFDYPDLRLPGALEYFDKEVSVNGQGSQETGVESTKIEKTTPNKGLEK